MESVKQILQRLKNQERIWCPHCGKGHDVAEYDYVDDLVTYWADGGPVGIDCQTCGEAFWAHERIERTYAAGKTVQDAIGAQPGGPEK